MIQTALEISQQKTGLPVHRVHCRGALNDAFLVALLQYFQQAGIPIQKLEWLPDWQQPANEGFQLYLTYRHELESIAESSFEETLRAHLMEISRIFSPQDKTNASAERIADSQCPNRR